MKKYLNMHVKRNYYLALIIFWIYVIVVKAPFYLTKGYTNYKLQYLKIALWLLIIILSFIFTALFDTADEKTFLKLSFILGIWVIILNPFVHRFDESTHFFRSFAISQGSFIDIIKDGKIGANISDNYSSIIKEKLSIKSYFTSPELWNVKFSSAKSFFKNPYMSSVTPINHGIAAIGIFFANLIGMDTVGVIITGRLCDYLFYTILCYFAIKNMKYYKTLFFTVAALPMTIWLAGSFSIDPILISTSLLFISICLKYYFDKTENSVTLKDVILLIFCSIFISSVKYLVYTPILLLFFLIPKNKFEKKQYIAAIVSASFIILGMISMQGYLLKKIPFIENRNGDVNVGRQVRFMLSHIIRTCRNFANYFISTSLTHIEGLHYDGVIEVLGRYLGIFAVFGAVFEKERYPFETIKKKKFIGVFFLGISFIIYAFTIAALYVGFTPVGKFDVEGIQTRYIVPFLVLIMIVISFVNIENKIRNYERKAAFIMGLGIINMLAGLLIAAFA